MSEHYKRRARHRRVVAILGLSLAGLINLAAEESAEVSVAATPKVEQAPQSTERASPAARSPVLSSYTYNTGGTAQDGDATDGRPEVETPMALFSRVLVFLILLTGLTYAFIHFAKKGKINIGALKHYSADDRLIVSETRMLGNRQYLMVVEYGTQKMLLAVTPGNVQHLCFLESAYEEEVADVMEQEYGRENTV